MRQEINKNRTKDINETAKMLNSLRQKTIENRTKAINKTETMLNKLRSETRTNITELAIYTKQETKNLL